MVSYGVDDVSGLLKLSGGGQIGLSTIENAIGDNIPGLFLRPSDVWKMGGLVINGIPNFTIKMRPNGSIGFNGVPVYDTDGGYIDVDSSGDGIQVYASSPAGNPTQGLVFEDCTIVGTNPGANCVHLGGGERACGFKGSTFVYNLSSAAGSYGVTSDTALSNNNGEDLIFDFAGGGGIAGNYAALGWGIGDLGQRSNDCDIYDLRTAGGTIDLDLANGGGLTFYGWYGRSNPSTVGCNNRGVTRCAFIGGEDRNTAGLCHIVSASAARTILHHRAVTQGGVSGNPTCQVSAGTLIFAGACVFNTAQAIDISGTGKVMIADPATDPTNVAISGSAGTLDVITATKYLNGTGPTVSGWTGTTNTLF